MFIHFSYSVDREIIKLSSLKSQADISEISKTVQTVSQGCEEFLLTK